MQNQGNPFVVFDLDDVLCNLREGIHKSLNVVTGKSIHWEDWDRFSLESIYDIAHEDCMRVLIEHEILENATLEPGVHTAVRTAYEAGYQVAILTARGWHPDSDKTTKQWLEAHNIRHDRLDIVPYGIPKAEFISRYSQVAFMLDDHPEHIRSMVAANNVDYPILRDRPWNRNDQDLHRVHSLKDFAQLLQDNLAYTLAV